MSTLALPTAKKTFLLLFSEEFSISRWGFLHSYTCTTLACGKSAANWNFSLQLSLLSWVKRQITHQIAFSFFVFDFRDSRSWCSHFLAAKASLMLRSATFQWHDGVEGEFNHRFTTWNLVKTFKINFDFALGLADLGWLFLDIFTSFRFLFLSFLIFFRWCKSDNFFFLPVWLSRCAKSSLDFADLSSRCKCKPKNNSRENIWSLNWDGAANWKKRECARELTTATFEDAFVRATAWSSVNAKFRDERRVNFRWRWDVEGNSSTFAWVSW